VLKYPGKAEDIRFSPSRKAKGLPNLGHIETYFIKMVTIRAECLCIPLFLCQNGNGGRIGDSLTAHLSYIFGGVLL